MKIYADCFEDEEIKQFINTTSTESETNPYMHGKTSRFIDFSELADFFSSFLSVYEEDTINGKPLFKLLQEDWTLFNVGISGSSLEILLQEILVELSYPFASSNLKVGYTTEISDCINYWDLLKSELKSKKRFLSDLNSIIDYGWDTFFDVNSLIDKHIPLYRARIHHNINETKPHDVAKMGCPPMPMMSEGRANPMGIPYLYLCKEIETTFYEVRSTFLDYISVGTFRVKDGITLNITDFTKHLSPFNNSSDIVSFTKGKLLRDTISRDLSKPLHRFDSHLEYIPTQFICEFIRYFCGSDGVQFTSSLKSNGVNFVLFDESNVECESVSLHQIKSLDILSERIS